MDNAGKRMRAGGEGEGGSEKDRSRRGEGGYEFSEINSEMN